jgi:hypothetical protein
MTIAVGVLATDGIVLAADTQLTLTNVWKGEGGKIMASARTDRKRVTGACAITGATSRYEYLRAIGDELSKDFLAGLDDADKPAAYLRLGGVVHQFYERHVVPFVQERPEVNVLIAYQRDGDYALWQSDLSALFELHEHGAVGIGAFAATAWLSRMWKLGLDIPTAVVMATFAVAVAKDSVDGCGKYTHVMAVEADQWRRIDKRVVNEIDQLYEVFGSEIQPALLLDCFGEQPNAQSSLSLAGFKGRVTDVIARLRDDTPESVKRWRQRRWERLRDQLSQQSSTDDPKRQLPSPE